MEIQWPLLAFSVLLGISSGAFVFLAIGEIKGKFKEVRFIISLVALICLALGGCLAMLHMGRPERITHLLGNMRSGLSTELFVAVGTGIVMFIYVLLARKDYPQASKIVGIIAGILGLILPIVIGVSYLMPARPAWDSFALPLMFLGTGLGMGFLLGSALVVLRGKAKEEGGFALKIALIGVIIMVATMVIYIIWIAIAPFQAPTRSILRVVAGDLALAFWLGVVIIGIVAPLFLTLRVYNQAKKDANQASEGAQEISIVDPKKVGNTLMVAFACSVVGSIFIRVIMYVVGTSIEQFIYH